MLVLCLPVSALGQEPLQDDDLAARLRAVAEKLVSPERCKECHESSFEVWENTGHAAGFRVRSGFKARNPDTPELHKRSAAKEIYKSLGLRTTKRGSDEMTPACLECHYTPELNRGDLRAGDGVTCESCHGPARDWVDGHSDYGVGGRDRQAAARGSRSSGRLVEQREGLSEFAFDAAREVGSVSLDKYLLKPAKC